jgi:hypothetical protein
VEFRMKIGSGAWILSSIDVPSRWTLNGDLVGRLVVLHQSHRRLGIDLE